VQMSQMPERGNPIRRDLVIWRLNSSIYFTVLFILLTSTVSMPNLCKSYEKLFKQSELC
jgi:hypothetical protein